MYDFDLSFPGWLVPLIIFCFLFSLTFPLALILLVFSGRKHGTAIHIAQVIWVVLSGLIWIVYLLQIGLGGTLGIFSYSFPLAVLSLAVIWKRSNEMIRRAVLVWLGLSGLPWVVDSIINLGGH